MVDVSQFIKDPNAQAILPQQGGLLAVLAQSSEPRDRGMLAGLLGLQQGAANRFSDSVAGNNELRNVLANKALGNERLSDVLGTIAKPDVTPRLDNIGSLIQGLLQGDTSGLESREQEQRFGAQTIQDILKTAGEAQQAFDQSGQAPPVGTPTGARNALEGLPINALAESVFNPAGTAGAERAANSIIGRDVRRGVTNAFGENIAGGVGVTTETREPGELPPVKLAPGSDTNDAASAIRQRTRQPLANDPQTPDINVGGIDDRATAGAPATNTAFEGQGTPVPAETEMEQRIVGLSDQRQGPGLASVVVIDGKRFVVVRNKAKGQVFLVDPENGQVVQTRNFSGNER